MLKINQLIIIELFFLLMISGCSLKKDEKQKGISPDEYLSVSQDSANSLKTVIIPEEIPFRFLLQFADGNQSKFNLWLPELIIFNCDSLRSIHDFPVDTVWFKNKILGYSVIGISDNGKYSVKYNYDIRILQENVISVIVRIFNIGEEELTDYAQIAVCVSPISEEFSDKQGSRTYIIKNNKLVSIKDLDIVNTYNHYPVKDHSDSFDPDQRTAVSDNFVCRQNVTRNFYCSITWDKSVRIDVNPGGLDCFHSHPSIGPLKPGDSLCRYGIIYFSKSSGMDAYEQSNSFLEATMKSMDCIEN